MTNLPSILLIALLAGAFAPPVFYNPVEPKPAAPQEIRLPSTFLERQVRQQLVVLPFYSVFDNLEFRVDGGTVELLGQVVNPTLKTDAETMVKHIEGVERVENKIEVLPPSPQDDRIRLAEYRAIYGNSVLSRYAHQAVPPIHIIVKNGHVTLEGVVATEADKNIANLRANSVPGVFSVTNNLKVENSGDR
jgi:hyperosmotically inducible periplasmic protein